MANGTYETESKVSPDGVRTRAICYGSQVPYPVRNADPH